MIKKIQENSVDFIPFEQSVSDFSLLWIEIASLIVHILKDRFVQKNITFTQKMILKKDGKLFLLIISNCDSNK
jgi:hypothetical protein